jgi:hypothetical protein
LQEWLPSALVGTVMSLQFPNMRVEVVIALQDLGDPAYQQRVWIEHQLPEPDYIDNLDENVHTLFDDIDVCSNPSRWVGVVLYPPEVEPLAALGEMYGGMISDLGDVGDEIYLADPRWSRVIELARAARAVMVRADETHGNKP